MFSPDFLYYLTNEVVSGILHGSGTKEKKLDNESEFAVLHMLRSISQHRNWIYGCRIMYFPALKNGKMR